MNRALVSVVAVVLIVGGIIAYDRTHRRVLIPGDRPVTEAEVRAKLRDNGYTDIQVLRSGAYFDVTAVKDGKRASISVDADTGRLANEPFHDADEEE